MLEVALVVATLSASFIGGGSGCDNGCFFCWSRWLVVVSCFIPFVGGGGDYGNGFFGLGGGGISVRQRLLSSEVVAFLSDMGDEVSVVGGGGGCDNGL